MMHCTNIEMPFSGVFKVSRMVLIKFMKICLSERTFVWGSFNPGVSIRIILPLDAILVKEVTASTDYNASNVIGTVDSLNFS